MEDEQQKVQKKLLVKILFFILGSLFLFHCSRVKDKAPVVVPKFHVHIPLSEEYASIAQGIKSFIHLSYPKAEITFEEGLSDRYEFAPFENWVKRAESEAVLKLNISFDKNEDLFHVAKFLKENTALIPFSVNLPSLDSDATYSEYRGEAIFCRMQIKSSEMYPRQLCREVVSKICPKEMRVLAKRFLSLTPASCSLVFTAKDTNIEQQSSKVLTLTGFPLPLKVKEEYPLTRFQELDEALLLNLFSKSE